MYVGTHVSFISASMAHKTNRQTNKQTDGQMNKSKRKLTITPKVEILNYLITTAFLVK